MKIEKGSRWRRKRNGNEVIVMNSPRLGGWVHFDPAPGHSGRKSEKRIHYFFEEFDPVDVGGDQ